MLGKPQKLRGLADPQGSGTVAGSSSSSPPLSSSSKNAPGDGGNVDRVLFNNLVEMVPLVESLMVRRLPLQESGIFSTFLFVII